MSGVEFSELLGRVRKVLCRHYGPSAARPFLMICDLLELLDRDKLDRDDRDEDVSLGL